MDSDVASKTNRFKIRRAHEQDVSGIIEAHNRSIHEKAITHYTQDIIDAWAPQSVSPEYAEKLKQQVNGNDWTTLVAEGDEGIIGFGQINLQQNILGAIYVRKNSYGAVGKELVKHLIDYAKATEVKFLEMDASINAEAFYATAGFKSVSRHTHCIGPKNLEMACVKMRLDLR